MRLGLGLGRVRGVPLTLPETIPGLAEWLKAGTGRATSGGRVGSGAGIKGGVAAKVSDPTRPSVATEGGLECPDFVGANSSELLLPLALAKVFCIAVVLRTAVDVTQSVFAAESSGAVVQCRAFADAPGDVYWQTLTGVGRTVQATYTAASLECWVFVCTGSRVDIYRNGIKTSGAGGTTLAADVTQLRLGNIAIGAPYFGECNMLDVVAYTGDIGDAAIGELDAYLRALRSVP